MGALEAFSRIVGLGGDRGRVQHVAEMRASFEACTGAFTPDDPWFEERSRAFWSDAVTRRRFGREVEQELSDEERAWLVSFERAHRGLFRAAPIGRRRALVDVWSGAEIVVTEVDDDSLAELDAAAGQLFDARVVAGGRPTTVTLLPGAVFHPREALATIAPVLEAARRQNLSTHETLDALLRMERTLRALTRVRAAYAYRPEALAPRAAEALQVRRPGKAPT